MMCQRILFLLVRVEKSITSYNFIFSKQFDLFLGTACIIDSCKVRFTFSFPCLYCLISKIKKQSTRRRMQSIVSIQCTDQEKSRFWTKVESCFVSGTVFAHCIMKEQVVMISLTSLCLKLSSESVKNLFKVTTSGKLSC